MRPVTIRTNRQIRAKELRVIGVDGVNYGIISLEEALLKAKEADLDLIEISPLATPPVAKIADFGKYQYEEAKKAKLAKAKATTIEVKNVQIKVGTGEHDLGLKAKKVCEWLEEGHRIKLELFLPGRLKYADKKFLEERVNRFLVLITIPHRIADSMKQSPKGYTLIIEKIKG